MGSSAGATGWREQRAWRSILIGSLVLSMGVLAIAIGAATRELGFISAVGSAVFPRAGPFLVIAAIPAVVVGLIGLRRPPRVLAAVTTLFGLVAVAGGLALILLFVSAVTGAGGSVNVLRAFDPRAPDDAAADGYEVYRIAQGKELSMSVFRPSGDAPLFPTLLVVRGAGWDSHTPAQNTEAANADNRWYADRGWLVLDVDYRTATDTVATGTQAPQDLACALAWTATNAERLRADVSRIVVAGASTSGTLALNLAYGAASGQAIPNCSGTLPVPVGVVASYPVVDPVAAFRADSQLGSLRSRTLAEQFVGGSPDDFPDRYRALASATVISPAAPPTLLIAPEQNSLIPLRQLTRFAGAATAAGVNVTLTTIPFANHGFDGGSFHSLGSQASRTLTAHFLQRFER